MEQLARHAGKSDAIKLLKDAALQLLDEDARFRAAVLEGKAYADRSEFIAEDEMDARYEEMLRLFRDLLCAPDIGCRNNGGNLLDVCAADECPFVCQLS